MKEKKTRTYRRQRANLLVAVTLAIILLELPVFSSNIMYSALNYQLECYPSTDDRLTTLPIVTKNLDVGHFFTYKYEFANVQMLNGTYVVGSEGNLVEITLRIDVIDNSSGSINCDAKFESQNPDLFDINTAFNFDIDTDSGEYTINNGSHSEVSGIFRLFADSEWQDQQVMSSKEGLAPLNGVRNTYEQNVAINFDGELQLEFDFDVTGDDPLNQTHDSVYYFDMDTGLLLWVANTPMDFFMMGLANLTYGTGKIELYETNFDLGLGEVVLPFSMSSLLLIFGAVAFFACFGISVKAMKNARRRNSTRYKKKQKKKSPSRREI